MACIVSIQMYIFMYINKVGWCGEFFCCCLLLYGKRVGEEGDSITVVCSQKKTETMIQSIDKSFLFQYNSLNIVCSLSRSFIMYKYVCVSVEFSFFFFWFIYKKNAIFSPSKTIEKWGWSFRIISLFSGWYQFLMDSLR